MNKRITALLLAVLMLLSLCACGASSEGTQAGTPAGTQDGNAAAEQSSSEEETMTAEEMSSMGDMYYRGDEVDYEQARYWYLKAGEAGYAKAYLFLGDTYYFPSGDLKDNDKAFEYYSKAAEAGVPDAMGNMGVMYAGGYGTGQDYVKAAEWYEKAIDAGCVWAARNLGNFYLDGKPGIEKDEEKGLELLNWAVENGFADANLVLGSYYSRKHDYEKAEECYVKAAEAGNTWALYNLGNMFLYQAEDNDKAEEWLLKASDAGIVGARARLGDLYAGHFGSDKRDEGKAIEWYTAAMESDPPDPYGVVQLGQMYYYGYGVEKDYEKAFELYSRSVELYSELSPNDPSASMALELLADLYRNGQGVAQDTAKADELHEQAQALQNGS